jgi:hypothetical protein
MDKVIISEVFMLNHEMDFEKRSALLYRNVCDFPAGISSPAFEEELVEGLQSFRSLLLAIYKDFSSYMEKDALQSYHNITYTAMFFLLALATSGRLLHEGNEYYLSITKTDFKKVYKKPSILPFYVLEKYGIYFEYFKSGHRADTFRKCDSFAIHFEDDKLLALALNYLGKHMPGVDSRKDYASAFDIFGKADFGCILMGSSLKRFDIDPLRPDILRTLGKMGSLWEEVVRSLRNHPGILFACNYFAYVSPQWIIHIFKKNRDVGTFYLSYDLIRFSIGLSYDQLIFLASRKASLSEKAQKSLENLHCISCGRCATAGEAIEVINSISVCPKESFERKLVMDIEVQADITESISILQMLDHGV